MKEISKIGFFSPLSGVGTTCGYGVAAVELIKAWQRQGIPVWAYDREAPVAFNMGQPHFYERVEDALSIGYTPWESSKVPDAWPMYFEMMDEVWTTCEANAEWYRAVTDVPVKVLHHGFNRSQWPAVRRSESPVFRFYHLGGDSPRKGAKRALESFLEAFEGNLEVRLTLKGTKFDFDTDYPNVDVLRDLVSQEELKDIYLNHHAFVYPTQGEGFGLNPFQAAATGMPTLVTDFSGPKDFMEFCWPLEVESMVEADYEPHEGLWAVPSGEAMTQWMLDVVSNQDKFFDEAYEKSLRMDKDWSWDSIALKSLDMMHEALRAK